MAREKRYFDQAVLTNPVQLGLFGASLVGWQYTDLEIAQKVAKVEKIRDSVPSLTDQIYSPLGLKIVKVQLKQMTIQPEQIMSGQFEVLTFVMSLIKIESLLGVLKAREEYNGKPREIFEGLLSEYGLK